MNNSPSTAVVFITHQKFCCSTCMPTFHNRLFSSYLRAPWMLCAYENTQMLAQVWARQKFSRHSTTTSSSSLFAYFFRSPQGKLAHTKQTIKRAIWTRLSLILFCIHKYGPTLPLTGGGRGRRGREREGCDGLGLSPKQHPFNVSLREYVDCSAEQ